MPAPTIDPRSKLVEDIKDLVWESVLVTGGDHQNGYETEEDGDPSDQINNLIEEYIDDQSIEGFFVECKYIQHGYDTYVATIHTHCDNQMMVDTTLETIDENNMFFDIKVYKAQILLEALA